ncbi:ATP-binding cassette domain-containing protein [Candidatus Mycoplasma haematominutum]|uniref:Cobalt ABC transporter, ATP-binding protein n=1 Tax=Candidatus Mycoplasma haematominutum 'Birmingham 1' TaxID=1116213 RepID=G8C2Z7_9MOLU|nr:ATP-binding cassette domain-containing protein [Candidatus Mycoplasma haematominutum]CCE66695.1 cobalt ABC transporter, ATP-binding protein [Candidatus Mycoplasma haematominutum 'Birmingham 1']
MLVERTPKMAVEMHKICFSYHPEKPFIYNLSISLEESKYYCIVGHNGSGKSTFSKLLTGLLKPQSGYVRILDQSISKIGYQRIFSCLGVVFQNPDSQFITSSIEEELAFGLENKKVPRKFMKEIVEQLIDSLDLYALKDKAPNTLSGGQKQKVAIASVLAFNPSLFLFDESSSMLSPIEKVEIVKLMKKLSSEYKKTVISITHDMEELLCADEIIIFSHGQIVSHIRDKNELFDLPFSFFFELSLNPPFASHLAKTLREEHFWDLLPCYSEEELIENIAQEALKKKNSSW